MNTPRPPNWPPYPFPRTMPVLVLSTAQGPIAEDPEINQFPIRHPSDGCQSGEMPARVSFHPNELLTREAWRFKLEQESFQSLQMRNSQAAIRCLSEHAYEELSSLQNDQPITSQITTDISWQPCYSLYFNRILWRGRTA